jgi:hypothetical protein
VTLYRVNHRHRWLGICKIGRLNYISSIGTEHRLLLVHAQLLAVDRHRSQQPVHPTRVRHRARPVADQIIQRLRANVVDQGADRLLAEVMILRRSRRGILPSRARIYCGRMGKALAARRRL